MHDLFHGSLPIRFSLSFVFSKIGVAQISILISLLLTPYPGTPLFRQMEAEGRLPHRDWSLYDTAHAVFRPKNMSPEELENGYAWMYRRLFSHASIWRRRSADWRAVAPYLATSYLYKRSNRFWRLLIKHHLVHAVWSPLVEMTRLRHLRFREELAASEAAHQPGGSVVPPACSRRYITPAGSSP